MSEYEREAFKALRDAQNRILEISYGETNAKRYRRLHKWAAQTDRLLEQEQRYAYRSQLASEAWARRRAA